MRVVFLAGGIASGKSTVATRLAELGARRCDLDQLSREVLAAGSPLLDAIAERFGDDLVDAETGELDRALLAERAFATPEATADLEALQHPAILSLLREKVAEAADEDVPPDVFLVEVPLLDKMGDALALADEVLVVMCPLERRRELAIGRGMDPEDFEARVSRQPSDEELLAMADSVIDNSGSREDLIAQVDAWWGNQGQ